MPLVIDPKTGQKKYVNPQQTSQRTSIPQPSSGNLQIQRAAQQAGVESPQETEGLLPKIINLLNLPSQLTERGLTGTGGYEQAGLSKPLAFGARMLLDPLNLIPGLGLGTKALKGLGTVGKAVGKLPGVSQVTKPLAEAFIPGAKLSRVSPQLAEELPALKREVGVTQRQSVEDIAKQFKGTSPEIKKGLGKLTERLARGEQLTPDELSAVQKGQQIIQKEITEPELARGISPELIASYFPRKAEREGIQEYLKFGGTRLSTSLGGAEKHRKFVTQEAGEIAGVKYKDAIQALASRTATSKAAQLNADYIKRLVTGEVKDIDGNPLVREAIEELPQGYAEFSIKGLKGLTAPKEAVQEIEKYYQSFISDDATNVFLKFYDSALGVWKGSVTSIFPAFHFRNMGGNLFNMFLGGFKNPKLLKDAADIQLGKTLNIKGNLIDDKLLEKLGVSFSGPFSKGELPSVLEPGKGALSYLNPLKGGRAVGNILENNSKIAFFLDRLNKGDDIKTAVAQTRKYLFDYSNLTPFEQNVMRRTVPFYTWLRNNIPLQVEQLIQQPNKYALLTKTFRELQQPLSEEEKGFLPSYTKEGLYGKIGESPEGALKVLSGLGLPFEDIGRLSRGSLGRTFEREVLGALTPAITTPIELGLGRDIFRGRSTSELGNVYGRAAKELPLPLKKWLDYKEEKVKPKTGKPYTSYFVNPKKYQLLQEVLPRILPTIAQPERGISFAKISEVVPEEARSMKEKKDLKALEKILLEKGIIKEFRKSYVPKNTFPQPANLGF